MKPLHYGFMNTRTTVLLVELIAPVGPGDTGSATLRAAATAARKKGYNYPSKSSLTAERTTQTLMPDKRFVWL